jgi:hypothetical protein
MAMVMSFEVGVSEKHAVMFSFDKFWGGLTITVDGNSVVSKTLMFGWDLVKSYKFPVGVAEVHHVQVDHHRTRFLAGFRPQPVYAYVDGQLVAQGVA